MRKLTVILLLFTASFGAKAASVDTINTYSKAMNKNIKAVVIRPDNYDKLNALPVVYLLHGHGGKYSDWIKNVPELKDMTDQYKFIIVCADGNVNSWYFDSPVNPEYKYETYVGTELVNWIDAHYNTIKNRHGRAIAGLSMGGHGAYYLAFKHQDEFGAAGSMSGGVDFRPFPTSWNISQRLGKYAEHPENWEQNTVTNMLYLLTSGHLALIMDCGTEDFFYKVNLTLHEKLLERNIEHTYIARPGQHNWGYWANAVKYQLLFFNTFFNSPDKELQK